MSLARNSKWTIIHIVVACVVVAPWSVHAQQVDVTAKEKFAEGRELFDEGRYAEAAAAFTDAWRQQPNWKLLYNIAQSEAAAKNYGAALLRFEEYLSSGGDEIPAERRDEVLTEIRRLRDIVAYVEITAGTEHVIVLLLQGREMSRQKVRLSSQTTRKLVFDAPSAEDPGGQSDDAAVRTKDQTERPVREKTHNRLSAAGFTTMGVGAAALIAMSVTGSVALSRGNALDEKYNGRVPDAESEKVEM
jgi:hypothetical protein